MTAIHDDPAPRLLLDGRPHQLVVAITPAGGLRIHHTDDVPDLDVALAELIDQLRAGQHVRLVRPTAGRNVMPCSDCGQMLHREELRWRPLPAADPGRLRNGIPIRRVVCAACHRAAR